MRTKTVFDMQNQGFQIAPMVDVMFILILFFMCSASTVQVEQQLSIILPGALEQGTEVPMVDEQIIEILDNGQVMLNSQVYDKPDDARLPQLIHLLKRYKASSDATKVKALITLSPGPNARYQRIIDVLDACTAAKISSVTFAGGGSD